MVWSNVLTSDTSMKIASFNINNVNRRLANLVDWLRDSEPDVVCLQELKAADSEFPAKALREAGYEAAWRGAEELERGRDPGALSAHRHPHGAARRPGRYTEPLPGSGGQWRPRRLALRAERQPPVPVPSSTTNSPGWSV